MNDCIARRAGAYRDAFHSTIRLTLPDALIAATAREYGATPVTRNVQHYPMTDVTVIEPYRVS